MSRRSIFFDKYQNQLMGQSRRGFKNKSLGKVEAEGHCSSDEEVEQELRTLKVDLVVPENGVGGGPRFLVQYHPQNHLFLDENEKVKSNLSNTLKELLRIDHSTGKDFRYFHVESLVKSFLPLQLVSNEQVQARNKEQLEKLKKEYNKPRKQRSALDKIIEDFENEDNKYEATQAQTGWEAEPSSEEEVSVRVLNPESEKKVVTRKLDSLNSSLRDEKRLMESFQNERKRKAARGLRNEHLMLGYKGGHRQMVGTRRD